MKVYRIDSKIILHFGIGLIGSSIYNRLSKKKNFEVLLSSDLDWHNISIANKTITKNISAVSTIINKELVKSLHIIWTAGKASFLANEKEVNYELKVFDHIITHIYNITALLQINRRCFYMMSSAGGLFEGQQRIDHSSIPSPKRPYGKLKLHQEKRAIEIFKNFDSVLIYRPSSVFSFNSEFGRRGLINTLIKNIKTKQTTYIYGSISTLRDYVLDDDVARMVIEDLTNNVLIGFNKYIIASGRPISILEIINKIQRQSNESPFLKVSIDKFNSDNITYNPNNIRRAQFGLEIDFLIKKALMENTG